MIYTWHAATFWRDGNYIIYILSFCYFLQNAEMVSMVKIVGQHAGIAKVARYATKKMAIVLLVRPDSQDHSAIMVWTKQSIF